MNLFFTEITKGTIIGIAAKALWLNLESRTKAVSGLLELLTAEEKAYLFALKHGMQLVGTYTQRFKAAVSCMVGQRMTM